MRFLTHWLSGLVFGMGLALAGMTSPQKILAFLDVAGPWDPSLLFVLGGAVVTAAVAFHWILKRPHPVFEAEFHVPGNKRIDTVLIAGSALFGIGWGIGGYCPGPGVALLAAPQNPEMPIFIGGLLLGILVSFALRGRPKSPSPPIPQSVAH